MHTALHKPEFSECTAGTVICCGEDVKLQECVWHTRMVPATTMTGNTRMVRPLLFVIRNMELIPTGWSMEPVSKEPGINPLSSKFQNSIRIETASQAGLIASLTSLICGTEYINPATCLHAAFLSRLSCRWFVNQPDLIRYEALRCHDPTLHCNNLFFTYPLWLGASFPTKLFDLWAKASKARAKDVVAQLLSTCMMLQGHLKKDIICSFL